MTMRIPQKGWDKETVLRKLEQFRADDVDWRAGRTWGYVYDPGREAEEVGKQAYLMYLSENALDPTVFPSISRMEGEIIAMAASHVGGDENVVGSFTTGGTESIILSVKAARDATRASNPEIEAPEMILPATGHAAFYKAAHYLGVEPVTVAVDGETFKADVGEIQRAITPNTCLIVGSAPSYAHGVIDPIAEIGALALERDLLFHVDACMGGLLLPYFRRLGEPVPPFGFDVPGVTSLSMDLHKYGYCPKGASLILHKSKEIRRYQIFACSRWTGYTVVNPTIGSTKPGGPVAAAWAVMHTVGDDGYLELARRKLECMQRLVEGVEKIADLRVYGRPEMSLLCVTSDTANVFHIIDEMKVRGWYIQPQLSFRNSQANIHISINASNVRWVDEFLVDLAECVEASKDLPPSPVVAMATKAFGSVAPDKMTPDVLGTMLQMAGAQGTKLPERMAEINEVLDSLSVPMREAIVTGFINELFKHHPEEK